MKKLKNIKSLLSREEMRQIQGGSGWCGNGGNGGYDLPCGCACVSNSDCIMGTCNKGPFNMLIWGTCCG
jgi:hypothetical protein